MTNIASIMQLYLQKLLALLSESTRYLNFFVAVVPLLTRNKLEKERMKSVEMTIEVITGKCLTCVVRVNVDIA